MIFEKNIYQNKKTKNYYYVTDIRIDATNDREGLKIVNYESIGAKSCKYSRELKEFSEKFNFVDFKGSNDV